VNGIFRIKRIHIELGGLPTLAQLKKTRQISLLHILYPVGRYKKDKGTSGVEETGIENG
jgi:hypothetical protein